MRLSDEEWVARARARVSRGESWETPQAEQVGADPADCEPAAGGSPILRCPYCPPHPPLEVVQRWDIYTSTPLLRCPVCYGFWAAGDSIAYGARDATDSHPSFIAAVGPLRCRSCFGHLDPEGRCTKCHQLLPLLDCPACKKPMKRHSERGITLDTCSDCSGTWFDVGELGHYFGLAPVQDLAASAVDEHACDDEPSGWGVAAEVALRLLAPFL